MRRQAAIVCVAVLACLAMNVQSARADERTQEPTSPVFTLEVDSDTPAMISFDAIAPGLGAELGTPVAPPSAGAPSRAAIVVRYRAEPPTIVVRATRANGTTLERSVEARGDVAEVRRETILLAGNVARDEASELLDALARRPEPAPPPAKEPPPPPPPPEERAIAVVALAYPVASNLGRPDVRTPLSLSFFYGRVGTSTAVDFGLGVVQSAHGATGVQMGLVTAVTGGDVAGFQGSAGAALANGKVEGAQMGLVFGAASGDVTGFQLSAGANLARKDVDGFTLSSGFNGTGGKVRGSQLASVNLAREVDGSQIGIVNVGKQVRGLQFGVVNVAEKVDGAAIGIVSITKDGLHPVVWASNTSYANAGFRFETKYMYTVAALALGTPETEWDRKSLDGKLGGVFAIGGRIPIARPVTLDVEGAVQEQDAGAASNTSIDPRVLAEIELTDRLSLIGGGGIRIPARFDKGSETVRPELVAGVRF